jgi:hypothetical protein
MFEIHLPASLPHEKMRHKNVRAVPAAVVSLFVAFVWCADKALHHAIGHTGNGAGETMRRRRRKMMMMRTNVGPTLVNLLQL